MRHKFSEGTEGRAISRHGRSTILVVEGLRDVAILRKLLGGAVSSHLRFFASQGRAAITSLARNVLLHEIDSLVVVVVDAGADHPTLVEREQARALEAPYAASRYRVFAFSPSLDGVIDEVGGTAGPGDEGAPENLEELRAHPQVGRLLDVIADLTRSESALA